MKKKVLLLLTQGSRNIDYEPSILPQINPIIKIIGGELIGNFILKDTDNSDLDIDKFYIKSENELVMTFIASGNPDAFPKSKKLAVSFSKIKIKRSVEEKVYNGTTETFNNCNFFRIIFNK